MSNLNIDIEERIIELRNQGVHDQGVHDKNFITNEIDQLIDNNYRSIVNGLDYDHMKDLFNEYMIEKFGGERLDVPWCDAIPRSFDAYVHGYKHEMWRLHQSMKR